LGLSWRIPASLDERAIVVGGFVRVPAMECSSGVQLCGPGEALYGTCPADRRGVESIDGFDRSVKIALLKTTAREAGNRDRRVDIGDHRDSSFVALSCTFRENDADNLARVGGGREQNH
jgi:hypothetical protein